MNSPPPQASDVTPPRVVHLEPKSIMPGDTPVDLESISDEAPSVFPALPSLQYTLYGRRLSLTIFVIGTIIDSFVLPIGLYFLLWYGFGPGNSKWHPLSASTVLEIVTAMIGGTAFWELMRRTWRLTRKDGTYRVSSATDRHSRTKLKLTAAARRLVKVVFRLVSVVVYFHLDSNRS